MSFSLLLVVDTPQVYSGQAKGGFVLVLVGWDFHPSHPLGGEWMPYHFHS